MAGPTDPPDWVNNNKGKVQAAFDRAQAAKQQMAEKVDSQQVKKSAPGMHLTPDGAMRAGPDRQAHMNSMKKDDAAAREARERAAAIQKSKESQQSKGKDEPER